MKFAVHFLCIVIAVMFVLIKKVEKRSARFEPRRPFTAAVWNKYQINGFAQGTTYHITYYNAAQTVQQHEIDSLFLSIDNSLSIYKDNSLISQFNVSSHGLKGDEHFLKVVKKSLEISQKSGGLFDITVFPLMEIWGFTQKKANFKEPTPLEIQNIKECIGFTNLHIKRNKVIKDKPCIKIDVNGIAQGYTVDVIADFLLQHKINNFMVEVGGEVRISGKRKPSNETMRIGIESPNTADTSAETIKKVLHISEGAVTTSGNYKNFYKSNGKIRSHLMNPLTGYPIENELISATVYAKDAMTADGYDNVMMNLGLEQAMHFVEKNKEIDAYFIYTDANGVVKDTATVNFYKLIAK